MCLACLRPHHTETVHTFTYRMGWVSCYQRFYYPFKEIVCCWLFQCVQVSFKISLQDFTRTGKSTRSSIHRNTEGQSEVKNGGGKCSSTSVPTALTRITDLERVRACKIVHRKRVYVRARVCRVCLHSYS